MKKPRLRGAKQHAPGVSNYVEVPGNLALKFTFVVIMLYGSMNLAQLHKW